MTPRDMTTAMRFLQTGDHELVIFGVLKRLHIYPNHNDFDDFVQEARLYFWEAFKSFPDDPSENPHQFLAYAQQRVSWRILDDLRKRNRTGEMAPIDELLDVQDDAAQDQLTMISLLHDKERVNALLNEVSSLQRHYLMMIYQGYPMTTIATKLGVSRKTLYKWRTQFKEIVERGDTSR